MKRSTLLALITTMAWTATAQADVFLHDSFEASSTGDFSNGVYNDLANFIGGNATTNATTAGGSIVGFTSGSPWTTTSGLPRVSSLVDGLDSDSILSSGASIEFRGANDTNNRSVARGFTSPVGSTPAYFSGSLSASVIDDNALSFISFSNSTSEANADDILDGNGFLGVAFGFKGDGSGGMDLVIRYRDENVNPTETVLVTGVSVDTTYTVIGKVDWNAGVGTDDVLNIWINPASATEPAGALVLDSSIGGENSLNSVLLVQSNYGTGSGDAVFMDELRYASTWQDLGVIPEPSSGLLLLGGLAAFALRRRRHH